MRGNHPRNEERGIFDHYSIQSLLEFLEDPTPLRIITELSVVFFAYFQLLYIQTENSFPSPVSLLPFLCYSVYMTIRAAYGLHNSETEQSGLLYTNSIINWSVLLLYLVRIVVTGTR